jgi:ParB family chromosome partitioning protein
MPQIPLSELRFGHDHPGLSLNSRVSNREVGLESLAASIVAKGGVIEPLVVVYRGRMAYVADGNRRLAALRKLAEGPGALLGAHAPIECVIREDSDQEAVETSLMANIERAPLHPVDAYEAFAGLVEQGWTETGIALRFGLDVREVRQRLALGNLAPEIRAAWRAGTLKEEDAAAFTLVEDPALQVRAYETLRGGGYIHAGSIRQALGASRSAAALALVGVDAYIAAGGRVAHDLFDEGEPYVLDVPILNVLAAEKLKAACEELVAEGWAWAADRDAMTEAYRWERTILAADCTEEETARIFELTRLESAGELTAAEAGRERKRITDAAMRRTYSAEQKKTAGVLVGIAHDGTFAYQWGYIRPGDAPAKPKAEAGEEDTGPAPLPRPVTDFLREVLTLSWATVIADYQGMAEELLLATWLAGRKSGSPVCFYPDGFDGLEVVTEWAKGDSDGQHGAYSGLSFPEALALVQEMKHGERSKLFCTMVASALDMSTPARDSWNNKGVTQEGVDAVAKLYTGVDALAVIRSNFTPGSYFSGAKKPHALAAIAECLGEDEAQRVKGWKKHEVEVFATEAARQKGWLPAELRVPGYSVGPTPLADRTAAAVVSVSAKRAARAAEPKEEAPAPEPVKPDKLPRALREHLLTLHALDAWSGDLARPLVVENDERAKQLSPGTVGALVRRGLAAKTTRKGPGGQRAAYYLTPAGVAQANAHLAAGARADG